MHSELSNLGGQKAKKKGLRIFQRFEGSAEVDQVLLELEEKWLVHEYHVLNRNCCDFAVALLVHD